VNGSSARPLYVPKWISFPDVVDLIVEARGCPGIAASAAVMRALVDGDLPDGPEPSIMTALDWERCFAAKRMDFATGVVKDPERGDVCPRFERDRATAIFDLGSEMPGPTRDYSTPMLELMAAAIAHFGISDVNQPKADEIREWLVGRGISGNIASAMVTIIRKPAQRIGGQRKINKRLNPSTQMG
jgi:hypothetical protein